MKDVAGGDATEAFEDVGHSPDALGILTTLRIGLLNKKVSKIKAALLSFPFLCQNLIGRRLSSLKGKTFTSFPDCPEGFVELRPLRNHYIPAFGSVCGIQSSLICLEMGWGNEQEEDPLI